MQLNYSHLYQIVAAAGEARSVAQLSQVIHALNSSKNTHISDRSGGVLYLMSLF